MVGNRQEITQESHWDLFYFLLLVFWRYQKALKKIGSQKVGVNAFEFKTGPFRFLFKSYKEGQKINGNKYENSPDEDDSFFWYWSRQHLRLLYKYSSSLKKSVVNRNDDLIESFTSHFQSTRSFDLILKKEEIHTFYKLVDVLTLPGCYRFHGKVSHSNYYVTTTHMLLKRDHRPYSNRASRLQMIDRIIFFSSSFRHLCVGHWFLLYTYRLHYIDRTCCH